MKYLICISVSDTNWFSSGRNSEEFFNYLIIEQIALLMDKGSTEVKHLKKIQYVDMPPIIENQYLVDCSPEVSTFISLLPNVKAIPQEQNV